MELDGAVYRFTVNALELAPSGGGGGLTVEDIVAGVWSEALPGAFTDGSAGYIVGSGIPTINSRTIDIYSGMIIMTLGQKTKLIGLVETGIEQDGANYRYTANTLEEAPTGTGGGGGTVDPIFVDEELTWKFEAKDQLTANNTVRVIVGFNAKLAMEFDLAIPKKTSLNSGEVLSVTPSTGLAITNVLPSPDRRKLHVSGVATIAGEYTVVLNGITVDEQEFPRRGKIIVESLTGT
jgi:hypothetical protein